MKSFSTFFLSILFLLTTSVAISQNDQEIETTTYYLIRHAEKDKSDIANRNPHLTEIGQARAKRWASFFSDKNIEAVYSTPYHRTKETALPTAQANKLEVVEYDPRAMYNEDFKKNTYGKNVLIVGHSNTTPYFTNLIVGKELYKDMSENDNSSLYIVTLKGAKKEVEIITVD